MGHSKRNSDIASTKAKKVQNNITLLEMPKASIKLQEIFIFSTSHRIPSIAILYIFIGVIQQVRHLGREVDEESNRKRHKRMVCSQKSDVPHTNFSIDFFLLLNLYSFLVSHKAPIILQRATKRAHLRKSLPVYLK